MFVDEGKAYQDGRDQHASIKVVLKKGQSVRQASVAPDLTPEHYQRPPPPPVPRFSEIPSALGKRRIDFVNGGSISYDRHGVKRPRQAEIGETQQDEDEVVPSVERTPELIADTQTSPARVRRPYVKMESPELSTSLNDVAPATTDELEFLPEPPPTFYLYARVNAQRRNRLAPRVNGVPQTAAAKVRATNTAAHFPITPPTDPRSAPQTSRTNRAYGYTYPSGIFDPRSSLHTNKFKSARRSLYDMPESDIEDSQMPGQEDVPLSPRSTNKISDVADVPDRQPSPFFSYNALSGLPPIDLDSDADATQAFIADKRHSVSLHNDFGDRALKAVHGNQGPGGQEIEIPATASDPIQSNPSQSQAISAPEPSAVPALKGVESSAADSNKQAESPEKAEAEKDRRKRRRKDKKKVSQNSVNGDSSSVANDAQDPDDLPASGRNSATYQSSRRSSGLDSAGEQLSQALQASAHKPSAYGTSSHLSRPHEDASRPSTSGSGSATTSTPQSRRSSSSNSGTPSRLGLGITSTPRKEKSVTAEQGQRESEPTFMEKLAKSKEDANPPKKKKGKTGKADQVMPTPSVENTIDLDKQCGVIDSKSGKQCDKAIEKTCHSKGLKRAVPGRSQPLDILLKIIKSGGAPSTQAPSTLATPAQSVNKSKPANEQKTGKEAASIKASEAVPKAATPPPADDGSHETTQFMMTASPNLILPKGMTAEQFKELRKHNQEHPQPEKPTKNKKVTDATKEAKATPEMSPMPGTNTATANKTSQAKTPVSKSKAKSATPAPIPAQSSARIAEVPATDATKPRVLSKPSPAPASNASKVSQPLKSALKKQSSKLNDRSSSAGSSGSSRIDEMFHTAVAKQGGATAQPASAKSGAAFTSASTAPSATKNSSTAAKQPRTATKPNTSATYPSASTSKPTPVPPTSSAPTLPVATPTPAPQAKQSRLKAITNQIRGARDSAKASPAPGPGIGSNVTNLGSKKVFDMGDDSDESSDGSESESESESGSDKSEENEQEKGGTTQAAKNDDSSDEDDSEDDEEDDSEDDDDDEAEDESDDSDIDIGQAKAH